MPLTPKELNKITQKNVKDQLGKMNAIMRKLDVIVSRDEMIKFFEAMVKLVMQVVKKNKDDADNLKRIHDQKILETEDLNKKRNIEFDKNFEEKASKINKIIEKIKGDLEERVSEIVQGAAGRDGRDAEEVDLDRLAGDVIDKLEFPEFSIRDIKGLEERLTELREVRGRKLGGGGFSKIHMEAKIIDDEVPFGSVNGTNKVFTLANIPNPPASVKVFVNGQKMKSGGEDYTLSGKTITAVTAPPTGSIILVDYRV